MELVVWIVGFAIAIGLLYVASGLERIAAALEREDRGDE